jgi:hypothetical protein
MAIANNTRIKLGASSPKKDAVVAAPGTPAAAGEVALWAAAGVDENLTESIMGTFETLYNYAKSNMTAIEASVATPVVLHVDLGGSQAQVEIDGTPTSDEVRLEIGQDIASGQRSHFLNRTYTRIRERWLEESK